MGERFKTNKLTLFKFNFFKNIHNIKKQLTDNKFKNLNFYKNI